MRLMLCVFFGAALIAVGCERPGAVQEAQRTLKADALVTIKGFDFAPKRLVIQAGQSVEWNNTEALETHTVTCDPALAKKSQDVVLPAGAEAFNSGPLKPGKTFIYTFKVPGVYRYVCLPHEHFGMVGEIEVRPAP